MSDLEIAKDDANIYGPLAALAATEGGQVLLTSITAKIRSDIDLLCTQYATSTEMELRARIARLSVNLELARSLNRAQDNYDGAIDLVKQLTA